MKTHSQRHKMTGGGKHFSRFGVPEKFTPRRDRKVKSQEVACLTCGADVGEPCKSANGKRTIHISRRRKALRLERGEG